MVPACTLMLGPENAVSVAISRVLPLIAINGEF
jgi:hypothetical protein